MNYPMAPLVLGIVLGPLLDSSFRRGMVLFDGNFLGFLANPIALVLALGCLAMVFASIPPLRRGFGTLSGRIFGGKG
jgi:putative tricarboxylic transport membrane protein